MTINPEQMVLGIAMLDNETLAHIRRHVAIRDFKLEAHQHLYRAMLELWNSGR